MSSLVNVLTNNAKILDIAKRDISKLNFAQSNGTNYKSAVVQISVVFETF